MVAIIETSGKQYCVMPGQRLVIDRILAETGSTVTFKDMLTGESLEAEVTEQKKGPKVVSRKFRNKTRYQRTKGHRQEQTVLRFGSPKEPTTKTKVTAQKKTAQVATQGVEPTADKAAA